MKQDKKCGNCSNIETVIFRNGKTAHFCLVEGNKSYKGLLQVRLRRFACEFFKLTKK
jgi:hypothetical protein